MRVLDIISTFLLRGSRDIHDERNSLYEGLRQFADFRSDAWVLNRMTADANEEDVPKQLSQLVNAVEGPAEETITHE